MADDPKADDAATAATPVAVKVAVDTLWTRTLAVAVPLAVGSALGWLATHGLDVRALDPGFEGAAVVTLTVVLGLGYHVVSEAITRRVRKPSSTLEDSR